MPKKQDQYWYIKVTGPGQCKEVLFVQEVNLSDLAEIFRDLITRSFDFCQLEIWQMFHGKQIPGVMAYMVCRATKNTIQVGDQSILAVEKAWETAGGKIVGRSSRKHTQIRWRHWRLGKGEKMVRGSSHERESQEPREPHEHRMGKARESIFPRTVR